MTTRIKFYLNFLFLPLLISCDKETTPPNAAFSFYGNVDSTRKMGTNDDIVLVNESKNGETYTWDFGDGRISVEKDPTISYPVSGSYEIKLIVSDSEGRVSETKKQVKIMGRILKKIVIEQIQWNTSDQNGLSVRWPKSNKADVFVQLQQFTDFTMNPLGIYPNCPVIYTSPVFKDVSNQTFTPIEINVNERIVIEKIKDQLFPYHAVEETLNHVYLVSLMAKDANDEVYNLYHNHGGGGNSISIEKEDIEENVFILDFSLFSRIRLICQYE